MAFAACGGPDDEDRDTARAAAQASTPGLASVTARLLAAEYARDATAAQAKYGGRLLEVAGTVGAFGTNKGDVSYVILTGIGGYDGGPTIQCVFAEDTTIDFSTITRAQPATLTGYAQGIAETVEDQEGQFALFISVGKRLTLNDCGIK